MAYIQKNTPPPNKIEKVALSNFVGGLNNRSAQLLDNQTSDVINMMFADETLMETRYGQKYHDEFQIDGEVVFIDEFKPYKDIDIIIKTTVDKLYINNVFIRSIAGKPNGVNHMGKYYLADGLKLYVYGKFGQVTTTYEKVIGTPVNDYILMEVVSPADGHARLDTSHVQGVLNVDYTLGKVYYEPCENEFVDTFSGANKVPENIKFLKSHNGRLFASGNDKDNDNVFISDMHRPFYYPVSLPMQLPPNSDKIVGMIVYDNSLVVGRRDDIYVIHGNTNRTDVNADRFTLRKLNSHTGFASDSCASVAHNYLFFIGNDGNAYSLSSTKNDESVLSTTIISKDIDYVKSPIDLTINDIKTATTIFFNDEWLVSIKDKVLVFSYRHRAWTMYNQINTKAFYKLGDVLIWGKQDGSIGEWDKVVFLDFGAPYQSHWYSKQYDMNDASSFKQFREFYLVAHTYLEYQSDITMTFEVDYVDVKDRFLVNNQISIWGVAKFGDRFINRNIVESLPFVIGRRGRNIRFKISNSYFVHDVVSTYSDLEAVLAKTEGMLIFVTDVSKYYLYTEHQWIEMTLTKLNQRMKIYQINGEYELRGKR